MLMSSLLHISTVLLRSECVARVGGFNKPMRHTREDDEFHPRASGSVCAPPGQLPASRVTYAVITPR